jgi:glycosyltransferase involved in cell wall biosynthesis
MLSVCIPVYNFNVTSLVEELSKQVRILEVPAEIIIIDDCSLETFRKVNEKACSRETYIKLSENRGRSKIRNLFLEHAANEYLLFLDCDSVVISDTFLSDYLNELKDGKYQVICGGRIYQETRPERERILRWKYGVRMESMSTLERLRSPNSSFMTNNFLINRTLFSQTRFDERIVQYGHEDTLFGFKLKQLGITIHHMHNPVLNGDLETNREYLRKSELAVINLVQIVNNMDHPTEFAVDVRLLGYYTKLRNKRITGVVGFLFTISRPVIYGLLANGLVSHRLFNFYKLGILIRNSKPGI